MRNPGLGWVLGRLVVPNPAISGVPMVCFAIQRDGSGDRCTIRKDVRAGLEWRSRASAGTELERLDPLSRRHKEDRLLQQRPVSGRIVPIAACRPFGKALVRRT